MHEYSNQCILLTAVWGGGKANVEELLDVARRNRAVYQRIAQRLQEISLTEIRSNAEIKIKAFVY